MDFDYNLALMTGIDLPFPELQTVVHQPTIEEISYLGEKSFFLALQYLVLNKNSYIKQETQELKKLTNFKLFITILGNSAQEKETITNFLKIIFNKYENIYFTPQSIILRDKENSIATIDENNFDKLQFILKKMFCLDNSGLGQQLSFNPKGEKAKEIAEKIMKAREKISKENNSENSGSSLARYISSLSICTSQSLKDLIKMSVYQIYDLLERYKLFNDWDLDIKIRLAGGKKENNIENWMKNIH